MKTVPENREARRLGYDPEVRSRLQATFEQMEQQGILQKPDLVRIYSFASARMDVPRRPRKSAREIKDEFLNS